MYIRKMINVHINKVDNIAILLILLDTLCIFYLLWNWFSSICELSYPN